MRKAIFAATLIGLLGAAPAAAAQAELKGKKALDFGAGDMLFSGEVFARNLEDCNGEVILIKFWGLRCPPCLASMPKIQRIWDDYKTRGLHIFHVESQNHTPEQILAYCDKKGYDFPQTLRSGESDFGNYPFGSGLPYAFLIGVDGKVIWQGRHGYEEVIAEEIKKVRYPGLGKTEIPKDLRKSAKLFATRKYGSAIKEARKKLEAGATDEVDPLVVEGAEYIIERANRIGEIMKASAESAKEDREYGRARDTLKQITRLFKGFPVAEEASGMLEVFKTDAAIKKEIKADRTLEAVMGQVAKAPTKDKQATMLRAFAKKFDGTRAAEKALARSESL